MIGNFHLNKWYLDFIGEDGSVMIFYAAKLQWHSWSVNYTSWLHQDEGSNAKSKYRFSNVFMPKREDNLITWSDPTFGISGKWESLGKPLQARIFESPEGNLDWNCFQPASKVILKIKDSLLSGRGYAEQLILTIAPWQIPMNELRWGRFQSDVNHMVWIELREKGKRQWLWLNGERIENCHIENDTISLPEQNLVLNLDRSVVLESEKKISSVVHKLLKYIPGFNKVIPLNFLMADEYKWLSKARLQSSVTIDNGMSIHELVNFKSS